VKAVVLVGGLGTRLRPLTFSIPKPLLPVGETPLLQIIVEQLGAAGIDQITLATGYQAELIHAFCGDGSRFGVEIRYVHEPEPLGTAGPLALVRDWVKPEEPLLLMNGDVLTQLDFRAMRAFSQPYELTVAYTTYRYQSPFGVLSVEDTRLVEIIEKPSVDYAVSAGIYILRGSVLDHVTDGFLTMPELINRLLDDGRPVGAHHIDGFWLGLETVARFEEAMQELQRLSADVLGTPPHDA
jgi:NDP-sugar pyrophosphorylase family protein